MRDFDDFQRDAADDAETTTVDATNDVAESEDAGDDANAHPKSSSKNFKKRSRESLPRAFNARSLVDGFAPIATPRNARRSRSSFDDLTEGEDDGNDEDDARTRDLERGIPSRRKEKRRTRGGAARAFARRALRWDAKALRLDSRKLAGERELLEARSTYANVNAWYDACEELAYEEARATMSKAAAGASESNAFRVVAERGRDVADGLVELTVRVVRGEKDVQEEWRRPWTALMVYREGGRVVTTALVAASREATMSSVPLWVRASDFPKSSTTSFDLKIVPLDSLLVHQRMVCACYLRPKVAFAHQLIGHKRATHVKFYDSEDEDNTPLMDASVQGGDDAERCDDDDLNASQRRAMQRFLNASHSNALQMVQGPPGCGKTRFVVALLRRLMRDDQRVLVCAPSNKAVCVAMELYLSTCGLVHDDRCALLGVEDALRDASSIQGAGGVLDYFVYRRCGVIALQLESSLQALGKRRDDNDALKTVRARARTTRERLQVVAPDFIKGDIARGLRALESVSGTASETLELGKEVMSAISCGSDRGDRVEDFVREALHRARLVFCTLASSGQSLCQSMEPPDVLLVDEAAQALEPEIAIPFLRLPRKVLLVGDPAQLPATMCSELARRLGHARSLMERLMSLDDSAANLLDTQYRMHPRISSWPSARYYSGRVMDAEHVVEREQPLDFPRWLPPYVFVDVKRGVEYGGRGMSKRNDAEAEAVCDAIQAIRRGSTFSIVVITFYSAQVRKIRAALAARGLRGFDVHSVDSFQGSEADVVVCSAVRSNTKARVGFLSDSRRLNVALTRAKHSLVFLASSDTLSRCDVDDLRSLVEDAREKDSWVTEEDFRRNFSTD